jgi:hypothetical protein
MWEKTAGRGRDSRATASEPLPVEPLVEADLWNQLPDDLAHLLELRPRADLYAARMRCSLPFTPRSPAVFRLKGRRGQRLIEAPGDNHKAYGFGLVDWRDRWFNGRIAAFPDR